MPTLPIIFTTPEDASFLSQLKERIIDDPKVTNADILLKYPTVYIHYWPSKTLSWVDKKGKNHTRQLYQIYIGESNDVIQRTGEHYQKGVSSNEWQHQLVAPANGIVPQMIVIGHDHFNKSMTLDVENNLIMYVSAMKSVETVLNGRGNPQYNYYDNREFDSIFRSIWSHLRSKNKDLFLSETEIRDSAIFKASPLKKLTDEQIEIKDKIIDKVYEAYNSGKTGQLIFVQGEAGTGKTVLTTSTFYDLIKRGEESDQPKLSCCLMVNHDAQIAVYEQMAKRLNLGDNTVSKPTSFINSHDPSHKIDVAFVDEGHLLLTQGKMSYRGNNQLRDIIQRARVTVVMFDEYQVLTAEEYWEPEILQEFKNLSISQGNSLSIKNQLRMDCALTTVQWINDFVLNNTLGQFIPDSKYEVKSFQTPSDLHRAIEKLAKNDDTKLSRVVASYDWDYSSANRPKGKQFWDVEIASWSLPWNYELKQTLSSQQKKAINNLAWAEQPHTIDEVGSTFTIQGFDLSYVGVILGPSVKYRKGKIVFDSGCSKNNKATQNRTLQDGSISNFGEIFIRNEAKVLLTRGINGLYIYACDDELRRALKQVAKI